MSALRPTSHLVERAVEAMGGLAGLRVVPPPALPEAQARRPAPPSPPHAEATSQPASPPAATAAPPPRPKVDLGTLRRAGLSTLPGRARSRVAEEVTVVQHQVLRTLRAAQAAEGEASRNSRTVLVTSARPGEGKTWCALNIAASLSLGGAAPVVLIDADGKVGCLSDLLGLEGRPGLRTLAGDPQLPLAQALADTELPQLLVLPFGVQPRPEMATVAPIATLAAAIQRVAAALPEHVLVVDAQPCLASGDSATLASIAGQILMVVEAERTSRSEVEAALDMVDACQTLQLVLNKVRLTGSDTFGAYA